ncbi:MULTISPECIES: O-antigen ligase family protein [unclassified Isoptericola]|uniref:O-antigen ligase family protein n=1 Tax=unclassified Isoptericola TaxID=2623355 RepID=UPI0036668BA3
MTTAAGGARPPAAARGWSVRGFDAVSLLTVYMVSLYAFPSAGSIDGLGSLGRPSNLVGLACLGWWVWEQISRHRPAPRPAQPVRVALIVLALAVLISYALAGMRGIPVLEQSVADSTMLRFLSWTGPALLATDCVRTPERFLALVHRIVIAGGLMATLGLAQFVTGQPLLAGLPIPGVTADAVDLGDRGGFVRASAMAAHPLEYATVLAAAIPLALNAALYSRPGSRLRRWYPSAAMILASLLAVSRSAILGTAAGILVLAPSWPRRVQVRLAVAGVLLLAAVQVLVPGMLSTLRYMFTGGDSSTESRVDNWGIAFDLASRFQPFGRGLGTFLPSYRILDNAYLLLLIEIGIVGVLAVIGLAATAVVVALRASHRATDTALRSQSRALVASVSAVMLLMAFFDAISFTMSVSTFFLVVGCCGAAGNVVPRRAPEAAHALAADGAGHSQGSGSGTGIPRPSGASGS